MPLDKITAPYGFVPLSDKIVEPEWLSTEDGKAPPVHDVPFKDGICGTLELEITAETPIFVRGTKKNGEEFFQLEDGRYAIPGTAIRGALRNIVEIITFSRFNRVNNHRYAVRDLNNRELYGRYMAEIIGGTPTPLIESGWLTRAKEPEFSANLEVCDFAKVEYRDLKGISSSLGNSRINPGRKQSARAKYETWASEKFKNIELPVEWTRPANLSGRVFLSKHGKVKQGSRTMALGQFVFTGQPMDWTPGQTRKKHHDFFFTYPQNGCTFKVSKDVFDDFEFAHSNRGQQNRLGESQTPNDEWGYWKPKFEAGERVPVFFLTNSDGTLRAFGLAMMFRLPYNLNIHDAISNANPHHLGDGKLDFTEGLFGTVREKMERADGEGGSSLALKGRVGFSHALALGSPSVLSEVTLILGAPKASYYPNYVEQDPDHPGSPPGQLNGRTTYRTWMDEDARPRGWKRYRVFKSPWRAEVPRNVNIDRVGTRFRPLKEGTQFRCHVDLHNLKPVEIGALLWALDFGGSENARHTLGLARPYGYGRSQIRVRGHQLQDMRGAPVEISELTPAFVNYMESQVPGWASSFQIRELKAIAEPVRAEEAKYQTLSPNEFTEAKNQDLALPSVAKLGQRSGWRREVAPKRAPRTSSTAVGDGGATTSTTSAPNQPQAFEVSVESYIENLEKAKLDKGSFHSTWVAKLDSLESDEDKKRFGRVLLQKVKELGWHKKWATGKTAKDWYQNLLKEYEG